ncbi:ribosome production factor 1-like protein, partial [Trifolium pratense]
MTKSARTRWNCGRSHLHIPRNYMDLPLLKWELNFRLFAGNDADEFSSILNRQHNPKILITTCRFNSTRGPAFISELLTVIPNAHYFKRGTYDLKKIVEYANKQDFTSVVVVHTNRREPNALLVIGLPNGPTAHFKLTNLVLRKDIKNHGVPTSHQPELVLNNFTTRLGHRVGRMIQSLFPQNPEFKGRRVVTFHNQRDFIFFRHHRYIFETKEIKKIESKGKKDEDGKSEKVPDHKIIARLQECGPRFTLKLVSLQHGTFDSKGGEYEWVHKPEWTQAEGCFSCDLVFELCILDGLSVGIGLIWRRG